VHLKGAEIDALCMAHCNIERANYSAWLLFELMKEQLKMKDLWGVEKAFVPVIKMNFDRIEIWTSSDKKNRSA
jgi:poly(A) polymerase